MAQIVLHHHPIRTSKRVWPIALAILALTGCSTTTPVEVNDRHAALPSFRVDIDLDEKTKVSAATTGRAVEFGIARAKGGSQQWLASGQLPVILGNTTFVAPQLIRNDFDFYFAELSYRWRKLSANRTIGLELIGGVGYSALNLSVVSATQRDSANFGNYGAQGGVGFIWNMRPSTSLNLHVSGFTSTASTGVSDFGRYQVFLAQTLAESLELRAGYAKWEVNGNGAVGTSDIRMTFSGPTLDVGLNF